MAHVDLYVCSDDGETASHGEEDVVVLPVSLAVVSAAPEVDTTGLSLVESTVVTEASRRHLQGSCLLLLTPCNLEYPVLCCKRGVEIEC